MEWLFGIKDLEKIGGRCRCPAAQLGELRQPDRCILSEYNIFDIFDLTQLVRDPPYEILVFLMNFIFSRQNEITF